jgi:hypothetical protein
MLVVSQNRVIFKLRGGLAFQNERAHSTVVGTLFSTVLDRAEQVGVRIKTSAFFFDWSRRYGRKTEKCQFGAGS